MKSCPADVASGEGDHGAARPDRVIHRYLYLFNRSLIRMRRSKHWYAVPSLVIQR